MEFIVNNISNIVQGITLIAMIWGILVAKRQLSHLRTEAENQYKWSMRKYAMSYSLSHSEPFRQARSNLEKAFCIFNTETSVLAMEEIEKVTKNNPSIHADILYVLAHWENMALAIREKIADEKVAFEMVATTVVLFTKVFKEFIEWRHKKTDGRAYEYLIPLSDKWETKLNKVKKKKQQRWFQWW
ncbi:DUF4760 domain-containing protein [Candidatus Parabeggiatoa sp. HSG14]|uniref:DUF4760 domain-containing protein n=1 Tax=Candidatus Parabeggiatoa sp. HSG14 TaxID=3055593 RepID=UPI0025A7CEDD|nr:DUF4760 domain-containing protein [Thiotrichales bacterium HSG14]